MLKRFHTNKKYDYFILQNSSRVETVDDRVSPSGSGDEKGTDVLYDRLLDDFDEDDDAEGSRQGILYKLFWFVHMHNLIYTFFFVTA